MTEVNPAPHHAASPLDAELATFIRVKLDTLDKWDLVQHFAQTDNAPATAPMIASRTGRDLLLVERQLRAMEQDGLLDLHTGSGVRVYQLTDNPRVRALLHRFLAACHDTATRRQVLDQHMRPRA